MIRRKSAAFTLIEILVVLVIISILITTVSLYSLNASTLQAKQTAKMIYALLGLTQQQAILQPAVFAFRLNQEGYTFLRFQVKTNNIQGSWVQLPHDPLLHFYSLPKKVFVQLNLIKSQNQFSGLNQQQNQNLDKVPPMIIFFNSGDFTPFILNIGVVQRSPVYKIIGYENGVIRLVNMQ